MLTASEKRRAFLIVMSGFMERFAPEIETGMTDARLTECIQRMLRFRVIWGGPGRFSGRCDAYNLKIWAGPTPLEEFSSPVLTAAELLRMARAEYEIPNPEEPQLTLF